VPDVPGVADRCAGVWGSRLESVTPPVTAGPVNLDLDLDLVRNGWRPEVRSRSMPLRLLHVTPYYAWAWAYGGIPRVVAAQARELVRRGLEVTVVTTDARDRQGRHGGAGGGWQLAVEHAEDGVEVVICRNLSNRAASRLQLYLPLGLDAYLRGAVARCDVAHLHACHNLPGVIAARRLVAAGVPYVVQPNGTAPRIERRRAAKLLFDRLMGGRVLRDAARVVAVTEAERRQLDTLGVEPGRVEMIPNPVDLAGAQEEREPGAFRRRLGLGESPVVLYLGQLSPRKRVDLAVGAVASLGESGPTLVVAGGDMGCEAELRRLVSRLGVGPRTRFVGVLSGVERFEALADADVVVYPSRDEIFGLVPLEALLAGTPVVVSGDCGCGEVVRSTGGGLVVEHGDVAALAGAIGTILRDPKAWRAPVRDAAVRVRDLFAPARVAARLHHLYDEVVATAPVRRREASP